jgi:diamine N-acetyltransferase
VDIPMISTQWETQRLTVQDSVLSDLPDLDPILEACSYIEEWSGWRHQHPESQFDKSMRPLLMEGELPPNGSKEFFRLQSIHLSESEPIIGFLAIYHGYPTPDIVWILYLFIHPDFQGKGYGQEIAQGLSDQLRPLGYAGLRLVVDLKNWPAIRFWVQDGFDRIIEVLGDKTISEETFAHFILEKSLV